jgi:two-component system sensor kinase
MKRPKILVIEDTEVIRDGIREMLIFEGIEVITAADGQEGIDKAKEYHPDLILCDIMMPKKSGYEVFSEIQNCNNLKHTPFIFLTAKATVENIREGMILGADDYITKPFRIDSLMKSINSRLRKEKKRKQSEKDKFETLQQNISRAIPHELLTPLNGIIGFSSLMNDPDANLDEKEIKEFTSAIFDSGMRLLSTIQKFIYYTEIEILLNNEDKKTLLSKEIIENGEIVLEKQSRLIAKKFNRESDIKFNIQPFNAKISTFHFEIIIANIVDNAFKFSKTMDKVEITIKVDEFHAHITVSDDGLGFDGKTENDIGAFTQFNRSKIEQQGLGFGLITSKKLIQFYGGDLRINENKTKGSRVKLSFLLAN